jgi:hypothetical protein
VSPGGSDPARCMPLLRRVRSSCVSIVAAAVLDNPHLRAVLDACGEQSTGMHAARNASHFRNMASRYLPPAAASSDPCPMPPPAAAAPVGRVVEFPSVLPAGDDARAGTVSFSLRARLEQLVLGREDRIGYRDKCALASLVRIARRAAINASLRISDVVIALEDTKRLHSLEMGDISCSVCLEEGLEIEDPLVLNPGGCEHICCRACAARIAVGASIVGMKCPVCRSVVDRFAALSYSSTRRQGDREAEGGQRPKRARSGTASAQEAEEILRSLPPDVRATRRALDALRAEGVRGTIAVLFESPVLVSDIRASLRAGAEAFEEVDQPGAGHGATVLLVRACGGAALRVELCGAIVFALPSPACYSRVQHHLRRFEGPVITCVAGGSIVERVLADALASGGGGLRRSDLCRAYLSRS